MREERGASLRQPALALRISVDDLREMEDGTRRPSAERVRQLTRHCGVDETAIDLGPDRSPSVGELLADALFE